ncbi:hypothetical protein BDP81DRAFT_58512 [Colletotrichum phormii]|uniref:Uncharacterized protein n=1 Tax=Colletotrichum phormii TaxID=359342 RepID=A0AAI9ZLW9_9PEZI|nr:uncharacterized protein BDP81DRAFT_58512 [Colletotrichum phormii]KAK1634396.1 hypothetical protein BDP81DRAFT_58512 [Colletotrichum phormii]
MGSGHPVPQVIRGLRLLSTSHPIALRFCTSRRTWTSRILLNGPWLRLVTRPLRIGICRPAGSRCKSNCPAPLSGPLEWVGLPHAALHAAFSADKVLLGRPNHTPSRPGLGVTFPLSQHPSNFRSLNRRRPSLFLNPCQTLVRCLEDRRQERRGSTLAAGPGPGPSPAMGML